MISKISCIFYFVVFLFVYPCSSAPVLQAPCSFAGFGYPVGDATVRPTWDPHNSNGYQITQGYNNADHHTGIDLANGYASGEVRAIANGVIVWKQEQDTGWGYMIRISHGDSIYSQYAHMKPGSLSVNQNQEICKGQVIGHVGNTGYSTNPHLHLEIKTINENGCGYIPRSYCSSSSNDIANYFDPLQFIADHACTFGTSQTFQPHPNGTLVKLKQEDDPDGKVYLLQGGQRRWITTPDVLYNLYNQANGGFDFSHVVTISGDEMSRYAPGDEINSSNSPLPSNGKSQPDGRLIKAKGDSEVSIVTDNGLRRPFSSGSLFLAMGYAFCKVIEVTDYDSYQIGTPIDAIQNYKWTQRFSTVRPPAREKHAMAYDAARFEVLLFGGVIPNFYSADTWVWDGTNWTQRFPVMQPRPRYDFAMAYDAARGNIVMFGGTRVLVVGWNLSDTWIWDGTNWIQKFPNTQPSARSGHAMAYDSIRHETVLFGGKGSGYPLGDTWVWDGATWTQRFPAVSPPARLWHSMVFDSLRGEVVLFGGWNGWNPIDPNDIWIWDGTNWIQKFPTSNHAVYQERAAYDSAVGVTIILGEEVYFDGKTWLWNGYNWLSSTSSSNPSLAGAMAYDEARREVVRFGGRSGDYLSVAIDDTWIWGSQGNAQYLSFVEGNPGVPGDGTLVSASNPLSFPVFHPSPPIAFNQIADGLTLVIFPSAGTIQNVGQINGGLTTLAPNKVGSCQSGFGLGFPIATFPVVTVNGVQGAVVNFTRANLESVVTNTEQSRSCGFTFNDFVIDRIFVSANTSGIPLLTALDAVAVSFSQGIPYFAMAATSSNHRFRGSSLASGRPMPNWPSFKKQNSWIQSLGLWALSTRKTSYSPRFKELKRSWTARPNRQ